MPPGHPFHCWVCLPDPLYHPFHCWVYLSPSLPPVSLLGVPQLLPLNTRFTVGCTSASLPPTRFTVGQSLSLSPLPVSLLGKLLSLSHLPVSLLGKKRGYPPTHHGTRGMPPCRICLSPRCYLRSPERLVLHTVDHVYRHVHLSGCGKCTFNTRVEERKLP